MAIPLRVLILGGTTEASALTRLLAGDSRFDATLSLAGRTSAPRPQPVATRIGGFGGAEGLALFLREQAIAAVVDATHPYADQIGQCCRARRQTGVPLASIAPPGSAKGRPWQTCRPPKRAATLGLIAALVPSLGRLDYVFAAAPASLHPRASPPEHRLCRPTSASAVARSVRSCVRDQLLGREIEIVVSKNSGGLATYPKIQAARETGLPVIMIARPDKATGHVVASAEAAVGWLEQQVHDRAPGSLRGV